MFFVSMGALAMLQYTSAALLPATRIDLNVKQLNDNYISPFDLIKKFLCHKKSVKFFMVRDGDKVLFDNICRFFKNAALFVNTASSYHAVNGHSTAGNHTLLVFLTNKISL